MAREVARGIGRARHVAFAALILSAGLALPVSTARAETAGCRLRDGEARTVTRVVDGETLQVDGGGEIKLAGTLSPRAFDAGAQQGEWPLAERTRSELERLVAGRRVILSTEGRRTDRYGRLIAHVFVSAQTGDEPLWVQGELLRRGLVRALAVDAGAQCMAELLGHEAIARDTATGLWAEPAYTVRGADEVGALLGLTGTYQVVEGKALRVSTVRGVVYVNFGEDQRQDFTVTIPDRAARALVAAGVEPQALGGRRVRVRGWIERRGGPLIAIQHGQEIQLLGEAGEAEAQAPVARRASRAEARRRQRPPSQAE